MFRLFSNAKRAEGLSLIEVVIAMAIGLIGTLGSYALLASVHGTQVENKELLEAQQEARNVMERMTRELRESSPEVIWPVHTDGEESPWIFFYTPRNQRSEFIVNSEGKPKWQRGIEYWLDENSHTLYRFQFYMSFDPNVDNWNSWFQFDTLSKNVEKLLFERNNDMLTINIRTFSENPDGLGNVAPSYADFDTTIKLRN